jgi:hypothetical protein
MLQQGAFLYCFGYSPHLIWYGDVQTVLAKVLDFIIVCRRIFKFCLIGLLDQMQDHEYFHKQSLNRKQVFNFCLNVLGMDGVN